MSCSWSQIHGQTAWILLHWMKVHCQTWWWRVCLQLWRVPSGGWWFWNDVQMPLETLTGTCWSNLPQLGVFFQGLERSQHLSLPKVQGGPHEAAGSPWVDCCTQYTSSTAWCSWWCLLPFQASRCKFWPSPWLSWCWHGFHGGQSWHCLCRTVERPLVLPWLGDLHWWKACHGSSSKIWLLRGHIPVCQVNCSGWSCAPLRGWGLTVSQPQSWSGISERRHTLIWCWLSCPGGSPCWSWMGDS